MSRVDRFPGGEETVKQREAYGFIPPELHPEGALPLEFTLQWVFSLNTCLSPITPAEAGTPTRRFLLKVPAGVPTSVGFSG